MSGRGRGRGRGGGPPSQSKAFLLRSVAEAGMTERDLVRQHQFYPDFQWHSSGQAQPPAPAPAPQPPAAGVKDDPEEEEVVPVELVKIKHPAATIYKLNKQRELSERFRTSAHHVQPAAQIDVVRYGQNKRQHSNFCQKADEAVRDSLGATQKMAKLASDGRYIPLELQASGKREFTPTIALSGSKKAVVPGLKLEELEREERARQRSRSVEGEADDDGDVVEADEEEEEVEDYTTNYDASDDEEIDGGDGDDEAVF